MTPNFSNSLCQVFQSEEDGKTYVAIGDGKILPYRQFILQSIFELASPYLISPTSNITAINGKKLAGMVGALLARQSRAPGTVVEVLVKEFLVTTQEESEKLGIPVGEVNEEKLEALIERILIQYGDDSVQELEFSTVLFNSVSNLAAKAIEDRRLGGFIEQSSRYVYYTQKDPVNDAWLYYRPKSILESNLKDDYLRIMDKCFEIYAELADKLEAFYKEENPIEAAEYAVRPNDENKYKLADLSDEKEEKMFRRTYGFDIRTKACDTARCVLPAATLTNLAMVANGRTFEHLLKRLYSSGREEFIDIANKTHETLNKVIPKYVKRANPEGEKFWMKNEEEIREDIRNHLSGAIAVREEISHSRLLEIPRLIENSRSSIEHLLAAVYFPFVNCSYDDLIQGLMRIKDVNLLNMLRRAVGERSTRRDRAARGFEHGYDITTEIVCDFGAFRDLHRHRMCTLQWQRLTPHHGFLLPEDIELIGMGDACRELAAEVADLYDRIASELGSTLAEHVVMFGHRVRFMIGMNLREAQHLLELRTVKQGHPNYRKVCQDIHYAIRAKAPWLDQTDFFKFVDHNDYTSARGDAEARQSQKMMERNIDDNLINE